jgi:hypothetical protein
MRHSDPFLDRLERLLNLMSDAQAHLDTQVAAITAAAESLTTAASDIASEIAALKTGNPTVDFTGLDAAVTALTTAVSAVQADDTPVTPPPGS